MLPKRLFRVTRKGNKESMNILGLSWRGVAGVRRPIFGAGILALGLSSSLASALWGAGYGTTGGDILRIPVGVRAAGMGEA